jgi:hypothetical protein
MLVYACLLVLQKTFWSAENYLILNFIKHKAQKIFCMKTITQRWRDVNSNRHYELLYERYAPQVT